jgi:hypothetical protein
MYTKTNTQTLSDKLSLMQSSILQIDTHDHQQIHAIEISSFFFIHYIECHC